MKGIQIVGTPKQLIGYRRNCDEFVALFNNDADIAAGAGDVCYNSTVFTQAATNKLRTILGIKHHSLTDEQVQCAELRAELEQARMEGMIDSSQVGYSASLKCWEWIVYPIGNTSMDNVAHNELLALTAAAECVRSLRLQPEPTLPDVEMMGTDACRYELQEHGWQFVGSSDISGFVRGDVFLDVTWGGEKYRQAVARARQLNEKPQQCTS